MTFSIKNRSRYVEIHYPGSKWTLRVLGYNFIKRPVNYLVVSGSAEGLSTTKHVHFHGTVRCRRNALFLTVMAPLRLPVTDRVRILYST